LSLLKFAPPTNLFWILADLLQVLVILILAEVVVSWLVMFGTVSPYRPWVRNLRKTTDPFLAPLRQVVPPNKMGGIDISPIIAIILISILQGVLYRLGS
jgi:YggT family protein